MEIEKTSLIQLLKNCRKIKIPFYQRDYSWDKDNVEKLLNDIYDSKTKHYFLGSIILKKGKGRENIIIDGQQRISTILLIYKVILKYSKDITLEDSFKDIKFDSANLKDGKVLFEIMRNSDNSFNSDITKTNYYKNYQVIDEFVKNKPDKGMMIKQLEKVVLSEIIVDQDVDEHILFSQINSTGKTLDAFDLVKNNLFQHISNVLENDLEKEFKISEMLNRLSKVSNLKSKDDVIRHFIGFKTTNLPNKNPKNIYSSFLKIFKHFYNNNPISAFDDLYKFFLYYNYLEKRRWEDNKFFSQILNTLIESIGTYCIVIIALFYENSEIINEEIDINNEQISIIKKSLLIIESYKFKRELSDLNEKTITRFIPTLPNKMMKKDFEIFPTDIKLYFFLIRLPKTKINVTYKIPNDNEFKNGMRDTHIYTKSRKITKSFLYRISTFLSKDTAPESKLTIEHVIPKEQEKWIKNGFNEDEEMIVSRIHTIGNLTLTAYNSELSNNIFSFKQEYFRKIDNFPLNKYFFDTKISDKNEHQYKIIDWNITQIEKRSEYLFEICQKIWAFDSYEKIINESEFLSSFKETEEELKEGEIIDFIAKNSHTFNQNKSYFKVIKDIIDEAHVKLILKNLMVYGLGTEKNEFKVFDVEKKGWVSQSIYDFLNVSSSEVKGKFDENEFKNFIKSKIKYIGYMIDYIVKELS